MHTDSSEMQKLCRELLATPLRRSNAKGFKVSISSKPVGTRSLTRLPDFMTLLDWMLQFSQKHLVGGVLVRSARKEFLCIRRRMHITRRAGLQLVMGIEPSPGNGPSTSDEAKFGPRPASKCILKASVDRGRPNVRSTGNNGCLDPIQSVACATRSCQHRGGHGEVLRALHILEQEGAPIAPSMLYSLLQECTKERDIQTGMVVQALIFKNRMESYVRLVNQLILMFAACGSLSLATQTFNRMTSRDVFAWAAIISAHGKLGKAEQAIHLYHQMLESCVTPNDYVYVGVIGACANTCALAEGRQIHACIVQAGLGSNVFIGNALINMYAKCGTLDYARRVFDNLSLKNVVSWSTMIAGYALYGMGQEALVLFEQMQHQGMVPDKFTFVNILKACTRTADIRQGKRIYSLILEYGFQSDPFVGSTLVNMFAKCGSVEYARKAFDAIPVKDQVSWNAMIEGYAHHQYGQEALDLFWQMELEGIVQDKATYLSIVKGCSSIAALEQGKLIHVRIEKGELGVDAVTGSILIAMYANCGSLVDAREVYEKLTTVDQVSCTAMMVAYCRQGQYDQVFQLYQKLQLEGIQPDIVTLVSILNACASLLALEQGMLIDTYASELGLKSDAFLGSALIDMYSSCGNMMDASRVFEQLPTKDLGSWTAIIAGCVLKGDNELALQLYAEMLQEGVQPSERTIISVLQACSSIAALDQGKNIHSHILELGLEADLSVGNALVHMYARCGSLEDAQKAFELLPAKDLVSWNTMLAGYAQGGQPEISLQLFQQMQQEGIHPDRITFLCLLRACSQTGWLDDGIRLFQAMSVEFNIAPEMDHYACLVDLLCRGGQLKAAVAFIDTLPSSPDAVVWMCLLGACRAHGGVELGRRSFEAIVGLDPKITAAYVLMSSIYSSEGMVDESLGIRRRMQRAGAKKEPGLTWMELDNQVHSFMVEDTDHRERKQIYATLDKLKYTYTVANTA